ncbi:MAG: restriction endonuclease [Candidatus Berkelbacteria bacterium]
MSYYDDTKQELQKLIEDFNKASQLFYDKYSKLEKAKKTIVQMTKERQIGFPCLAKAYDEFFELQDKNLVDFLKYKKQPAISASEVVSEYSKIKRKAEREARVYKKLVDYYESVYPSLIDLREEVEDIDETTERSNKFTPKELEDDATYFLSVEEYRKLPSYERNQMALERYWTRPHKKVALGKMYERYVGYLYENRGYDVEYHGIVEGKEDLGRDLICRKGTEHIIVQCKYWSQFRTIYEKHIFQLFGTFFQYRDEHLGQNIQAVFYTSTKVSDLAKRFAKELKINLMENQKMDKSYPCIKCNISKVDGTKIYHLPFDQQYDNVKIEKNKGEFYCKDAKEAEDKGFRRAYKYKGLRKE